MDLELVLKVMKNHTLNSIPSAGSDNIFNATLSPNGFKKFTATASILNPSNLEINNKDLDAADRTEENKSH